MTKYRKKPVEIDAIQFDGSAESAQRIVQWVLIDGSEGRSGRARHEQEENGLYIETLEGSMHASAGDFIIRGVQGEFYPCKPDIFEATYEEVN